MAADQSGWFHDHQSAAPVEEASEFRKYEAIASCHWRSFLLAFLE